MNDTNKIPYKIEGERITFLITRIHQLLKHEYKNSPLWVLVKDVIGHGSTISNEICIQCGFDPNQNCSVKELLPIKKPFKIYLSPLLDSDTRKELKKSFKALRESKDFNPIVG